jgi:hypothetical protein
MLINGNLNRLIATYNNEMLDWILPMLLLGKKGHVLVFQDELIFHMNEYY